ncbi:hypothetical protein ACD591_11510 [Rufibacter glacialis]|uniref:Uncharacterized protein n=1 Tax=Rufibacter glacialis TaxID=1259555 RepID=A0A5M8QSC9_9BACT|nr:hypothetical protein [Rufibacter glacialis]KAA6437403.1 hypothetical protein FOE74_02565 [Rufibacter glacialis]GGK59568.1 hypothetical protein GCM10011405_04630 [Rufibacter glacialis]
MRLLLLTFLLLGQWVAFGQTGLKKPDFSHKVIEAIGDLNKDGLPDKVIVSQDTLQEQAPYRLQIFFKDPKGRYNLIATSTKIIAPQYPDGREGYETGNRFSEVTIKNGVVSVGFELLRGHYVHKFRFQNGNFELIGFSKVASDGRGVMETIDFNLSTGIRIEKAERYDTDQLISTQKKKILIRPLPRLQEVVPMENGLY